MFRALRFPFMRSCGPDSTVTQDILLRNTEGFMRMLRTTLLVVAAGMLLAGGGERRVGTVSLRAPNQGSALTRAARHAEAAGALAWLGEL